MKTNEVLKNHLDALRAKRESTVKAMIKVQADLDAVNLEVEKLRARAKALAAQVKSYGADKGEDLATLDKEIAQVALAIGSGKMSDAAS